jgi:ribosomal protein L35
MKTNKAYAKRLRVTKKGTIVSRTPGHNHFNARMNGAERRRRGRASTFHAAMDNTAKSRYLA